MPGRVPGTPGPTTPPPPRSVPAAPPEPSAPPPPAPPPPAEPFVVYDDVAPSGHHLSDHDRDVAAEADAIAHVIEDDNDTLNVPAPPPEAFAPRPPRPRPQRELVSRTVGFKQTLIPILLTQGVLLPGIGAYLFSLGDESPLVGHIWIPLSLLVIGFILLLFAALTMLQVKDQLAREAVA
jgi:hypothetical protein